MVKEGEVHPVSISCFIWLLDIQHIHSISEAYCLLQALLITFRRKE